MSVEIAVERIGGLSDPAGMKAKKFGKTGDQMKQTKCEGEQIGLDKALDMLRDEGGVPL